MRTDRLLTTGRGRECERACIRRGISYGKQIGGKRRGDQCRTRDLCGGGIPARDRVGDLCVVQHQHQLSCLRSGGGEGDQIGADLGESKLGVAARQNRAAGHAALRKGDGRAGRDGIGIICGHQCIEIRVVDRAADRALLTYGALLAYRALQTNGALLADGPLQTDGALLADGSLQTNGALLTDGALLTYGPLQTNGALLAYRALQTNGALLAYGPLQTNGALFTNGPLQTNGALFTYGPLQTNRALLTYGPLQTNGALLTDRPLRPHWSNRPSYTGDTGNTLHTGRTLRPGNAHRPTRPLWAALAHQQIYAALLTLRRKRGALAFIKAIVICHSFLLLNGR